MKAPAAGVVVTALILAAMGPAPRRSPAVSRTSVGPRGWQQRLLDAVDRAMPSRRRRRRDRQLPDALDRLGASLRAGEAVGAALMRLADAVADPLGVELRAIARSIEHGAPVADALEVWAASDGTSRDVRLVAAALTIGAGSGGEVARAVDGVAVTLRERHEVLAEARALATQARASAAVLATAPLVFALLVATVEPHAIAFLFTTPLGVGCLILGVGLDVAGWLWMARITGNPG
ncbi:MAG: type II secretion system F family protein [Acidimicrobiales bacterium]